MSVPAAPHTIPLCHLVGVHGDCQARQGQPAAQAQLAKPGHRVQPEVLDPQAPRARRAPQARPEVRPALRVRKVPKEPEAPRGPRGHLEGRPVLQAPPARQAHKVKRVPAAR